MLVLDAENQASAEHFQYEGGNSQVITVSSRRYFHAPALTSTPRIASNEIPAQRPWSSAMLAPERFSVKTRNKTQTNSSLKGLCGASERENSKTKSDGIECSGV